MSIDLNLLSSLMDIHSKTPPRYVLHLEDSQYVFADVSITNSPTPVNSPTTRGGVYFSDKFAYKIKGVVTDMSVVPLLSKTMLGPNTTFDDIKITTQIKLNGKKQNLTLLANLINSVQSSSQIELNMILVNIKPD